MNSTLLVAVEDLVAGIARDPEGRQFKSDPRNHFVKQKAGIQDSGLFFPFENGGLSHTRSLTVCEFVEQT